MLLDIDIDLIIKERFEFIMLEVILQVVIEAGDCDCIISTQMRKNISLQYIWYNK